MQAQRQELTANTLLQVALSALAFRCFSAAHQTAASPRLRMHSLRECWIGGEWACLHSYKRSTACNSLQHHLCSRFGRFPQVAGVRVALFQHALRHGTPDAVFPNNWFTTHPAGEARGGVQRSTLALYPLKCPNRRAPTWAPGCQSTLSGLSFPQSEPASQRHAVVGWPRLCKARQT